MKNKIIIAGLAFLGANVFAFAALQVADEGGTSHTCTALQKDLEYKTWDGQGSNDIRLLQTFLGESKLTQGDATGFFGDETLKAVKAFQDRSGLPSSGFVGSLTREKIRSASCGTATTAQSVSQAPQPQQGSKRVLTAQEKVKVIEGLKVYAKNTELDDEKRLAAQEQLRQLTGAPAISIAASAKTSSCSGTDCQPTVALRAQIGLSESERVKVVTQLQNMLTSPQLTKDQKSFIQSRLKILLATTTPLADPDIPHTQTQGNK